MWSDKSNFCFSLDNFTNTVRSTPFACEYNTFFLSEGEEGEIRKTFWQVNYEFTRRRYSYEIIQRIRLNSTLQYHSRATNSSIHYRYFRFLIPPMPHSNLYNFYNVQCPNRCALKVINWMEYCYYYGQILRKNIKCQSLKFIYIYIYIDYSV